MTADISAAYVAGILTPFLAAWLLVTAHRLADRSRTSWCDICGWRIGTSGRTPRLILEARRTWHVHVARRIGQCVGKSGGAA